MNGIFTFLFLTFFFEQVQLGVEALSPFEDKKNKRLSNGFNPISEINPSTISGRIDLNYQ